MAQGDKTLRAAIDVALRFDAAMTLDMGNPAHTAQDALKTVLANGAAAGQANEAWGDERTLSAASEEELDMAGTVPGGDEQLVNAWGDTIQFAKVKAIFVRNLTTTSTFILQVGGSAANALVNWVVAATDAVNIGAGGLMLITAPIDGWGVTDETADLLTIKNPNAAEVTYRIILVGVKA